MKAGGAVSGASPLLWTGGVTEHTISPSPLDSSHGVQPIWHQEDDEGSGSAWPSWPSGLSFSLDRGIRKWTWSLPWRNVHCLGLFNSLSAQYFVSSYKPNILSSLMCVFRVLECRDGGSPPCSLDSLKTKWPLGHCYMTGAFLLACQPRWA